MKKNNQSCKCLKCGLIHKVRERKKIRTKTGRLRWSECPGCGGKIFNELD